MNHWALYLFLALIPTEATIAGTPVFDSSVTERPASSKPFWINQTVFLDGDHLFIVGVATKRATLEEGRARSLEVAKAEMQGVASRFVISDGQNVTTKDIHEEREEDGTFTTYRLLMVKVHDYSALLIDPDKAKEVAEIMASLEAQQRIAASEAEAKKIKDAHNLKRWHVLAADFDYMEKKCITDPQGPSCRKLKETDITVALIDNMKAEMVAKRKILCEDQVPWYRRGSVQWWENCLQENKISVWHEWKAEQRILGKE